MMVNIFLHRITYSHQSNFFQKRNFLAFLFPGWVVDNKNRDWEFRISVYYVSDEDTNTYICKTPRGKSNSITVIVTGK